MNRSRIEQMHRKEHLGSKRRDLAILDSDKKMRMKVNVSDHATEGVLSTECKDR